MAGRMDYASLFAEAEGVLARTTTVTRTIELERLPVAKPAGFSPKAKPPEAGMVAVPHEYVGHKGQIDYAALPEGTLLDLILEANDSPLMAALQRGVVDPAKTGRVCRTCGRADCSIMD